MAVAARYSYVTASSVGAVFKTDDETKSATKPTLGNTQTTPGQPKAQDPWAGKPRLNILLLGGDAGPGRVGTRTDTVILASINTKTGDTALISLPRNAARMPFPSRSPLHKYYPYGFTNGDGQNAEYFLNAMYRNVPRAVPKDILGPTDNLGADVLKLSVGEATGLAESDRMPPSIAAATICVLNGARILRMHDVPAAVAAARMIEAVLGFRRPAYLRHNMS